VGSDLGGVIALALGGQDVHQDRTCQILDIGEGLQQMIEAMAIHRPEIVEFEGLEEHPRGEKGLQGFLAFLGQSQQIFTDAGDHLEEIFSPAS
jgi:hypothetical protein